MWIVTSSTLYWVTRVLILAKSCSAVSFCSAVSYFVISTKFVTCSTALHIENIHVSIEQSLKTSTKGKLRDHELTCRNTLQNPIRKRAFIQQQMMGLQQGWDMANQWTRKQRTGKLFICCRFLNQSAMIWRQIKLSESTFKNFIVNQYCTLHTRQLYGAHTIIPTYLGNQVGTYLNFISRQ